jgi:hypothetical protein
MIANVWSLLAKSSRGDCTEWPCTFNPSRANVIDRDAFNLGRIRRRPEKGRQPLLRQTMSDKLVAATEEHQFRNPHSAITRVLLFHEESSNLVSVRSAQFGSG